jgi:ectoine hydroxylase-related dioxygenase (phytanoyl-CoA dioxygenase family)
MVRVTPRSDGWADLVRQGIEHLGVAIVEDAVDPSMIEETRDALYRVRDRIVADVGRERLERAAELGVLRLMMKYDPFFFRYLALSPMLEIVDRIVSPAAILHLQNGFILPSLPPNQPADVFQTRFHQDFPRVMGGFVASVNVMVAVDPFTPERGATSVVPGAHQRGTPPTEAFMTAAAVTADCPAGSLVVFDSTLWHRAGHNTSGADRLAINHQFTRSYFKQQIDYVRALGPEVVEAQSPRTQRLLGWYTRVVTSLDEYYQPEEKRLYRRGQG